MNRDELWSRYTAANPHWLTEGARLTPAGIRKLVETTFDAGHRLGLENGRAMAESERPRESAFDDLIRRFPWTK